MSRKTPPASVVKGVNHDLFFSHFLSRHPAKSDKLYPTALHFAASFGLKNITNYLLGLPGADHAGTIRNRDNLNPSEMAKKNGHDQLADIMSVSMRGGWSFAWLKSPSWALFLMKEFRWCVFQRKSVMTEWNVDDLFLTFSSLILT